MKHDQPNQLLNCFFFNEREFQDSLKVPEIVLRVLRHIECIETYTAFSALMY